MSRRHPPEPTWRQRWAVATTPETRLLVAYDAVRAAARRLERKRQTGLRGNRYAAVAEELGQRAAADFRDEVALLMVNAAERAWHQDWERTVASGHRGRSQSA